MRFHSDESHEALGLGPDVRREVWLIFKESVNNVVRHSKATQADISVVVTHGSLQLRVSDNGRGFSCDSSSDGNGLVSMRQRAGRLGATFDVVSEPGAGTVVMLRVPLTKRSRRRASVA